MILVAGVGNVLFGDDGFGCEVVRELAARALPSGVEVVDFGVRTLDLGLRLLDDLEVAIVIDAMMRGGPPGTLYVIEPDLPAGPAAALDAHGLSPSTAIVLAHALGGRAPTLRVVGCEPLSVEPGGLSAVVAAAIGAAVALVLSLIAGSAKAW